MKPLTTAIIQAGRNDKTLLLLLVARMLDKGYDEGRLLLFAINRLHMKPRFAYEILRDAVHCIN